MYKNLPEQSENVTVPVEMYRQLPMIPLEKRIQKHTLRVYAIKVLSEAGESRDGLFWGVDCEPLCVTGFCFTITNSFFHLKQK